jgi:cytochrome bd-type quinol oxidase subunit 2
MTDATKRDVLIVVCAMSAGVHAALVPEHLSESAAAGGGFVASAVLLAALAVALTRSKDGRLLVAAALTLLGLLVSYVLAVTSGMPVLMPRPEPVEGIAVATKAIEVVGLLAAIALLRPATLPVVALARR